MKNKQTWFLWILFGTFIALGLPDTGFGVAWNEMRLSFSMPLEAAGILSAIVIACGAMSGFFTAKLIARLGTGTLTAISTLATALAIVGYSFAPNFMIVVLWSIPLGFGAGAVDAALNIYAAQHLSSKHMNWLHSCWGIGATLSPMIITFGLSRFHSWRAGYLMIGVLVFALSILIWSNLKLWKASPTKQVTTSYIPKENVKGIAPMLSIVTYVIYVALEGGLGLWMSALLLEARGLSIAMSGTFVSCYFASIMIGRFLLGFLANRMGNRQLIQLGLSLALFGSLLFFNASNPWIYGSGILLLGFGFAPIYPSLMHETSARYPHVQANRIIGYQVSFSYVSSLIVVPLVGVLATTFGLEVLPLFVFGSLVGLALVIVALNKRT
ncbi:MAG: MFS transporter [Erysipelotrichaceae bacterium]